MTRGDFVGVEASVVGMPGLRRARNSRQPHSAVVKLTWLLCWMARVKDHYTEQRRTVQSPPKKSQRTNTTTIARHSPPTFGVCDFNCFLVH